jgi:hypothetical protein
VVTHGALEESERVLVSAQAARVDLLQSQDVGIGPADECQDRSALPTSGAAHRAPPGWPLSKILQV